MAADQHAAAEACKVLDTRTREIEAFRFERAAADGIDSTPKFLTTERDRRPPHHLGAL